MKQIKSILLGISLFLLHSCNLLDVDTVSSITGDGYWNTKGDVESYLIGIYTKLRDTSNSTLHFEDRGDAFTTGLEGGPSNLWAQNLTSQNGYGWSSYYSVIQHCNMLLKYTPGISFGVESDKNRLLAEAYCIRGYMYFCVARIWGDAPIELEPTESSNKPKLASFRRDHPLKGHWHSDFFHNDRPIVLELGCGKGEYTVALAERDPNRNFIGIDIKGARMWRGAKTATERQMRNVGFLRTRIEMIASFFAEGEVDEIWITFPDPQLKSRRAKKRLTSPLFLGQYAQMQVPGGRINLKTDSQHLYAYTQAVIERFGLPCDVANNDIYGSGFADEILSVKTAYEQMFLERKLPITYTRFSLGERRDFPPFDWEGDDTDEKDNEEARKNDISDRTSRSSYANP